jgi:F-box interacting protein
MSTKCHHLMVPNIHDYVEGNDYDYELVMYDSPIPSLFSPSTVVTQTQLYIPNGHHCMDLMCSCDGMFCGTLTNGSNFLWNPSITKFKLLPPLENHKFITTLSFGYDHFIDNYKVIVVSDENKVCVNTLGTDYWRRIEDIPYHYFIHGSGIFVCGTVNWISSVSGFSRDVIISLDLEKESYQNLCLPDFKNENVRWTLGVLRDCLCVFAHSHIHWDVWIMKEYGNKDSWTKLYTFPNLQDRGLQAYTVLYSSEDDQLLVECCELQTGDLKLVVYDPKTGTSNSPEFQNNDELTNAKVYIESLISP